MKRRQRRTGPRTQRCFIQYTYDFTNKASYIMRVWELRWQSLARRCGKPALLRWSCRYGETMHSTSTSNQRWTIIDESIVGPKWW